MQTYFFYVFSKKVNIIKKPVAILSFILFVIYANGLTNIKASNRMEKLLRDTHPL